MSGKRPPHGRANRGILSLLDALVSLRRLLAGAQRRPVEDLLRHAARVLMEHPAFSGCVIRLQANAQVPGGGDTCAPLAVSLPSDEAAVISAEACRVAVETDSPVVEPDVANDAFEACRSVLALPIHSGSYAVGCVAVCSDRPHGVRPHQGMLELFVGVLQLALNQRAPDVAAGPPQSGCQESRGELSPAVAGQRPGETGHAVARETRDPKTGLLNRIAVEDRLQRLLEGGQADALSAYVLYLDVDRFGIIEEIGGAVAADRVIRMLSELLRSQMGDEYAVARLAGDQFCVVVSPGSADYVAQAAQTLIGCVQPLRLLPASRPLDVSISISIGISATGGEIRSAGELIEQARDACREAQRHGGGTVRFFKTSTPRRRILDDAWLLSELSHALKDNTLTLFAQPIARISHGGADRAVEVVRHEILLRNRDAQGGILPAGLFLPVAERYGLSVRIDRWVVREALRDIAGSSTEVGRGGLFTINLSGHSIGDEEFLAYVVEQFEVSGLAPARVCFELTETAAISDIEAAQRFMRTLREIGCHFALDDFGSGHASYLNLRDLPVDLLKIDGLLIREVLVDPVSRAIVRSVHDIARVMGIRTVAEYVESSAMSEMLSEIGVDYQQGFWIGSPVPLKDVLR